MHDRRWRGNPTGAVMPAVYPWLVRYCIQGIRSVDKRDELAGRMVRGKILSGLGIFCRARIGCWMKMKLMVCVLPVSLLKLITGAYNWGKSALVPK